MHEWTSASLVAVFLIPLWGSYESQGKFDRYKNDLSLIFM